jgi:hypothetical protein
MLEALRLVVAPEAMRDHVGSAEVDRQQVGVFTGEAPTHLRIHRIGAQGPARGSKQALHLVIAALGCTREDLALEPPEVRLDLACDRKELLLALAGMYLLRGPGDQRALADAPVGRNVVSHRGVGLGHHHPGDRFHRMGQPPPDDVDPEPRFREEVPEGLRASVTTREQCARARGAALLEARNAVRVGAATRCDRGPDHRGERGLRRRQTTEVSALHQPSEGGHAAGFYQGKHDTPLESVHGKEQGSDAGGRLASAGEVAQKAACEKQECRGDARDTQRAGPIGRNVASEVHRTSSRAGSNGSHDPDC